tara:strand:- start:6542 stop:6922 length:381 start_codon:yes stop_codon:yes gene_type:complete
MKNLIVDLDGTLTTLDTNDYKNVSPNIALIKKLHEYKEIGFDITIATARNMRTFSGDIGKINTHTLPVILDWLENNDVPFDRVIVGKPWCGTDGFYIDDKSIRPSEFIKLTYDEIQNLLEQESKCY